MRRARIEKSKGRVKTDQANPRQAVGAVAATAGAARVSEANHCGVAVTGLNETHLQQSLSQVPSCLANRMHGKSATMVLMTAGNELGPVFDSLARDRARACVVGRLDAVGHRGQVRKNGVD